MRTWLIQTLTPLASAGLLLAGVVTLGRLAADDLHQHERYALAFDEVRCEAPPGLRREEFLREVQYEAELPDHLDRFDVDLVSRLRAAFLRHPWVERVERVEMTSSGPLHIHLTYRTPVLAIAGPGPIRVLDRNGILLPRAASADGLLAFRGKPRGPAGPTGTPWSDPSIVAAARTAGFLLPQREQLGLSSLEVVREEVVLWTSSGSRILWGSAPGREGADEASAVLKRDRLLNQMARHPGTEGPSGAYEHDLRPAAGATQRPLGEAVQVGSRGQP